MSLFLFALFVCCSSSSSHGKFVFFFTSWTSADNELADSACDLGLQNPMDSFWRIGPANETLSQHVPVIFPNIIQCMSLNLSVCLSNRLRHCGDHTRQILNTILVEPPSRACNYAVTTQEPICWKHECLVVTFTL